MDTTANLIGNIKGGEEQYIPVGVDATGGSMEAKYSMYLTSTGLLHGIWQQMLAKHRVRRGHWRQRYTPGSIAHG
jgi:hypothetical protein